MSGIFGIDEVFELLGKDALSIETVNKKSRESIEVEGFKVYRQSLRYATFYQKGTTCVCCGRQGAYFKLEEDTDGTSPERRHFNLYSEDGMLMTKDHIRPLKLKGEDHIDNMQTLCEECNKAKGSKYSCMLETIVARNTENPENEHNFLKLEDAVVYICDKRHILGNKSKPGKLARKVVKVTQDILNAINMKEPYNGFEWFIEDRLWEGKSYGEQ